MLWLRAPTLARCSGAWRRMRSATALEPLQTFQLVDRRVLRVGGNFEDCAETQALALSDQTLRVCEHVAVKLL